MYISVTFMNGNFGVMVHLFRLSWWHECHISDFYMVIPDPACRPLNSLCQLRIVLQYRYRRPNPGLPFAAYVSGLILGLRPANGRRCYFTTTSLIGWVQAQNQPYIWWYILQQNEIQRYCTMFHNDVYIQHMSLEPISLQVNLRFSS